MQQMALGRRPSSEGPGRRAEARPRPPLPSDGGVGCRFSVAASAFRRRSAPPRNGDPNSRRSVGRSLRRSVGRSVGRCAPAVCAFVCVSGAGVCLCVPARARVCVCVSIGVRIRELTTSPAVEFRRFRPFRRSAETRSIRPTATTQTKEKTLWTSRRVCAVRRFVKGPSGSSSSSSSSNSSNGEKGN